MKRLLLTALLTLTLHFVYSQDVLTKVNNKGYKKVQDIITGIIFEKTVDSILVQISYSKITKRATVFIFTKDEEKQKQIAEKEDLILIRNNFSRKPKRQR